MSAFEIITFSTAGIALIISILAFLDVKNIKRSASATIEWQINEKITATKEKVSEITMIMTPLLSKTTTTAEEKRILESYQKLFDLAIENNLNAYEAACSNYIDNKVDKVRFKKLLRSEIKSIVEDNNFKKYFDGVSSPYKAVLKVYKEWEDLEK